MQGGGMYFYERIVWGMQGMLDRVRGNKEVAKAVGIDVIAAKDENVPLISEASKQQPSPFNVATEKQTTV